MLERRVLLSLTQVFALFLSAGVVLFAFLNTEPVVVDLYFTQVRSSVALLVLGSLLGGVLLGWSGARRRGRLRRGSGRPEAGREAGEMNPEAPEADQPAADSGS